MKSKISIFIILLALLLGCGREETSKGDFRSVKIGYLPITADVSLFVGMEKGLFERNRVRVEAVRFTSANQAMDALISGRIQAAIMIGYSTLFSIFEKDTTQFKIVQSAAETENRYTAKILIRTDSNLDSISQLKGQSIGTYEGLTQKLNLMLVLRNFMDPVKDVNIIQVASNLQIPALSAGQFDALFTIDPYATIALENGVAKVLEENPRYKYILSPFPTAATVFSRKFINEDSLSAKRIFRALNEAVDFVELNPQEASQITAKPDYTPVTQEIAKKCGVYKWWKLGEEDHEAVQRLADILFENRILKNRIDTKLMYAKF